MQEEKLRELIERAAKECGSKSELGRRLGVSPQRINDWQTGVVGCPPEDVALIAYEAGMPADEWLIRATLWKHKEKPKGGRLERVLGKLLAPTGGAIVGFFAVGVLALEQVLANVRQCILC